MSQRCATTSPNAKELCWLRPSFSRGGEQQPGVSYCCCCSQSLLFIGHCPGRDTGRERPCASASSSNGIKLIFKMPHTAQNIKFASLRKVPLCPKKEKQMYHRKNIKEISNGQNTKTPTPNKNNQFAAVQIQSVVQNMSPKSSSHFQAFCKSTLCASMKGASGFLFSNVTLLSAWKLSGRGWR